MKTLFYTLQFLKLENDTNEFNESKDEISSNSAIQSTMQPAGFSLADDKSNTDADLENFFPFLDSPLRPATPDMNDPRSVAFYEEHKQLAKEYFKVQSELLMLESQLKQHQQQEESESLAKLQNEYESLVLLKNFLTQSTVNNMENRMSADGREVLNRSDR
ncbi:hypothetical protein HHI36_016038 [Cryptolaemus montrouzieri]|uniref:Mitogen-activated protein kinase kinase kinase n=1 Tax=Cryptolaemus montrouzieri TaxID=559131 RepID=A0ABD2N7K9_9CUCU